MIATDSEGYLLKADEWSTDWALVCAKSESIDLQDAHWEILNLVREFYTQFDLSPAMRPLVKYIKQELGSEKGNSIYLMTLFPGSPAKLVAKLAGLPRPANCL